MMVKYRNISKELQHNTINIMFLFNTFAKIVIERLFAKPVFIGLRAYLRKQVDIIKIESAKSRTLFNSFQV